MRLRLSCALLFVAAAFVVAQETGGDKAKESPNKDVAKKEAPNPNYYPVDVGNAWKFRCQAEGKEFSINSRVSKHDTINGKSLALLECLEVNMNEHLTQNAKGVFRHRTLGAEVTPPFQLLVYPPTVGAKWKGEFKAGADEGKNTYAGEIEAEEEIEVPAGKFKTIRVQILLNANGQPVDTVYWFAKDVGFVKQTLSVAGKNVLLELQKFERAEKK